MRDKASRRRLRIYSISGDALVNLFKSGTFSCPELPSDAIVDGVQANWANKSIDVCFWHESFNSVPKGELIPTFNQEDSHAT